jgi:hypothetical protein
MGDAELVEIWIRATPTSWDVRDRRGSWPLPRSDLKKIGKKWAVKQHNTKEQTYQALSLFPIDWSLGLGGHWKTKVRGWLHKRRVTEGGERSGELRAGIRLRHIVVGVSEWSPEWGSIEMLVEG